MTDSIESYRDKMGAQFNQQVQELLGSGWKITSDGPTGIQFSGPKNMRGLDKACLVFGILTFWIYGIGLFFIFIALLDYWLMTKPEEKFLQRPTV